MIEQMKYEENFYDIIEKQPGKVILYGAGTAGQKAFPYFERVDFYCDKDALKIGDFHGVKVLLPNEIIKIEGTKYIVVCVNKHFSTYQDICHNLDELGITAKIFNLYDNIAFSTYQSYYTYECLNKDKPLRVRIVSYDRMGWILTKFAKRLEENLKLLGADVDIDTCCDPKADINHHIPHHPYEPIHGYHDTMMIAHVDCLDLLNLIKFQLKTAEMGVCMSKETLDMLVQNGVPREKLCYVNPGQDGMIRPKKYVLGITHRNHESLDHRKKIKNVLEICKEISPEYFSFLIMGDGWDSVVEEMSEEGFTVEYYDHFDYDKYTNYVMTAIDYYLFFGYDEGSMGFMDAMAAGVKTIVTPQGFHLDFPNGITHACRTLSDFVEVLQDIQLERKQVVDLVTDYTWMDYARKHLEIWQYLARRKPLGDLLQNKHKYNDGIFSVLLDNIAG